MLPNSRKDFFHSLSKLRVYYGIILGLVGNQNGGMVLLTGDTLFLYTSNLFVNNLYSDAKKDKQLLTLSISTQTTGSNAICDFCHVYSIFFVFSSFFGKDLKS